MFALTRLRLPIAVIVVVVFAALLALAAFSSEVEANHSWGDYHWAVSAAGGDYPFTLKLGDNVSSTWDRYLSTASSDWSRSDKLDTTVVAGQSSKNCRPTSGRVEVCNGNYGWNGWLGIAGITVSGKHITQAYTKLNDTYFDDQKWYKGRYDTPAWRSLVMCQEVGHTFGLDHQDEDFDNPNLGTCMDYSNDPDGPPSNEHPNSHDYDQLKTIYDHLESTTTVGQTSAANKLPGGAADEADRDNEGPRQWGQLIRQSRDGRLALYSKDLGSGYRQFRFVIWADDAHQLNGKGRQDAHA